MISREDIKLAEEDFNNLDYEKQLNYLNYLSEISDADENGKKRPLYKKEFGCSIFVSLPPSKKNLEKMLNKLNEIGQKTTWQELFRSL